MKFLQSSFVVLMLLMFNLQYAQEGEQELSLDSSPVEGQFEYVKDKSGNYHADGVPYEVVKLANFEKLRSHVMDTINTAKKEISELKSTINGQENTIASLNTELKNTSAQLTEVTEEKDSMSFLGLPISKGMYNFILWSIIFALLLLALFFIYRFRNSNSLTVEAKNALSELETEYEQHRRRALEREQKISRQLQDEINRLKKGK